MRERESKREIRGKREKVERDEREKEEEGKSVK